MTDQHSVSRRETLKGLGAVGAAVVLGGAAPAGAQPPVDPVELAVTRFTKGHS